MAESDVTHAEVEGEDSLAFEDPEYREAVVDLLAVIGYGLISAFERLGEDATLAPHLEAKVQLGRMAAGELGKLGRIEARMAELGSDPFEAMEPFMAAVDAFHANTAPADWYEGLVKAYVGDGLANDFYREIAAYLDAGTRSLVIGTLEDAGYAAFAVAQVRGAIAADPRLGGRLALWGRRLMGEALIQAQRVAAEREGMSSLLAGGIDRPGLDLAALGRMFTRLTERHAERMAELGLDS
ncbi:ferritin-like fold-containing protein [Nocardioides bruguierae]|uniref:Ferritin-like domain-containing protein n=1 Tax=Nocardioides bruguierae TaxID=2945102 RepID=A0A9X2D6X4_9ACTN|nr:ferritin-like fold-containing protein [Nocardioides bruguierae]MCL8024931.1 ferritin-like domain-containing protein [Nocardioides bruguierae]MCM0619334.1 ferritin-like domain-containing protein [Nocardioides bruguierae]